jgi:hypothetical protein
MPDRYYRLRVRNAADTADAFIFSSVRGGTNPYIIEPPSGDGQEVDLLTGAVRTGAYQVRVADADTGTFDPIGTVRTVTQYLYDAGFGFLAKEDGSGYILLENGDNITVSADYAYARPDLLSRKAFVEMSTNGTDWPPVGGAVWMAGYITNITQDDAITYSFTVSDSRRVEQTQQIFTWSSTVEQTEFPQRGCIWGGPVIGGFGAQVGGTTTAIDTNGWEFAYKDFSNGIAVFQFQSAAVPPDYNRIAAIPVAYLNTLWGVLKNYLEMNTPNKAVPNLTVWQGLRNFGTTFSFPNITILISDPTNVANKWRGTLRGFLTPTNGFSTGGKFVENTYLYVTFDEASVSGGSPTPAMTVDKTYRVRAISRDVTPESPLYFDFHPADVAAKLYKTVNIPYRDDGLAGSLGWIKERLGPTLRLAARITEPQNMAEFLERAIFGPFGFAVRTNSSGLKEFFITRRLSSSVSVAGIITNNDLRGDQPPAIYSLDESTAVTGFKITQRLLAPWVQIENTTEVPPPDNLVEQAVPKAYSFGDTTTYSTRVVEYDIPGMVHDEGTFQGKIDEFNQSVLADTQWRFTRGAPIAEVQVLGSSPAALLQIGDEVELYASWYPNRNFRIGESSVGPRVLQIVRRDETPEGPNFKLVDSGLIQQPTLTPSVTIAASSEDPRRRASFTITNAGLLNSLGDASVTVQYATGSSSPTEDGTPFVAYQTPAVPTTAVLLPPVIPASKVWVRARVIQKGLRPSPWTTWTSVTLTSWSAPTTVTTDYLENKSTQLLWSIGSNTDDQVEVYLAPGSVAPSDWTPYRINTLSAGTTRTNLINLIASTNYIAGVAFRDVITNSRSSIATKTFTTTSSSYYVASADRPFAKFINTVRDVRFLSGVPIALYGVPDRPLYFELQRAPNVAGSSGTYATIARIDGFQTMYVDQLPVDNTTYWYRIKAIQLLVNDSAWLTIGSTTAGNVPPDLIIPPQVPPTISYSIRLTATQAIVSFDINGQAGGVNNDVTGGGVWSGDLSASPLIFPPDYTSSPVTLARGVGTDALFTIGARRDGFEDRAYFTVPAQ